MTSKPPFVAQERSDTCAVACLRMVLAARGIKTTEQELVQARMILSWRRSCGGV
jgi:hypothetical protein